MKARDFIYNFTDILFTEMVKSTILIENWEEADYDFKYVEFPDIFLKMKEAGLDPINTDEAVIQMLENSKVTTIKQFNKTMQENFIDEFKRHGINNAVFKELLPADILKENEIKKECLKEFRRFEERTFNKKPESGV
jgi:hypothetical protein